MIQRTITIDESTPHQSIIHAFVNMLVEYPPTPQFVTPMPTSPRKSGMEEVLRKAFDVLSNRLAGVSVWGTLAEVLEAGYRDGYTEGVCNGVVSALTAYPVLSQKIFSVGEDTLSGDGKYEPITVGCPVCGSFECDHSEMEKNYVQKQMEGFTPPSFDFVNHGAHVTDAFPPCEHFSRADVPALDLEPKNPPYGKWFGLTGTPDGNWLTDMLNQGESAIEKETANNLQKGCPFDEPLPASDIVFLNDWANTGRVEIHGGGITAGKSLLHRIGICATCGQLKTNCICKTPTI